jgi:L-threonylcarbamoyladenylate synthase
VTFVLYKNVAIATNYLLALVWLRANDYGATMQKTPIVRYSKDSIAEAAKLIRAGQCVAVPTETVYGLAADATNGEAVAGIYAAKGRPSFNPLIVHVADLAAAERIGLFNPAAQGLAKAHWPGPLTIVVNARPHNGIASIVTAGLPTVALRVPSHPAMQDLIAAVGKPIAAPSANASGSLSPTRAEHVAKTLDGQIPLIIDDGVCSVGIESTIVSVHPEGWLRQLRPGAVYLDLMPFTPEGIEAPGQMESHYAPSKPIRLNVINADADEWHVGFGPVAGDATLSHDSDVIEAAAKLFTLLHRADSSDKARIAVAPIPDYGIGTAIIDRLTRAAA